MFEFANHRHQIGQLFLKNIFRRLGFPAARRTIQRVDGLSIVRGDDAPGFTNGLRRQWIFGSESHINLAGIGIADVITL